MIELDEKALVALLDEDVRAWNRGDLEGFCKNYASDAIYISSRGCIKGRENILAQYRARYAVSSEMGSLSLQLIEFRSVREGSQDQPPMASAVLKWLLISSTGEEHTGFSLIVLKSTPSGPLILQDAST